MRRIDVVMLIGPADDLSLFFFFFNDTATTEIYTLSLHDALPISENSRRAQTGLATDSCTAGPAVGESGRIDRKSTRLNSSHSQISYAVFCLKKKKKTHGHRDQLSLCCGYRTDGADLAVLSCHACT